jgi:hypothetical protein
VSKQWCSNITIGAIFLGFAIPTIAQNPNWQKVRSTAWEEVYIDPDSLRDTSFGKTIGVIVSLPTVAGQASSEVRFVEEIQCQGWRHRTLSINGHYLPSKSQNWVPIASNSTAAAAAKSICAAQSKI